MNSATEIRPSSSIFLVMSCARRYEVCFELITTSGLTDALSLVTGAFRAELAESETLSANLVLVDNETLQARYDEALNRNRPYINYEFFN